GIWGGVPYRWVISVAVYLVLYASYAWGQDISPKRAAKPLADPSLLMVLSVGVAVLGFLASYYPCPVSMDLWLLLTLEVDLGVVSVPYGAIFSLAIVLLLCAAYSRAQQKRAANLS